MANITTYANYDKFQFGFKQGHSTSLCTCVVKKVVDYYISRGSHVFICFIDFTKVMIALIIGKYSPSF